jgi:hypothetical protein
VAQRALSTSQTLSEVAQKLGVQIEENRLLRERLSQFEERYGVVIVPLKHNWESFWWGALTGAAMLAACVLFAVHLSRFGGL